MTPSSRAIWSWTGVMPLAIILVPAGGLGLAPMAGLLVLFAMPLKAAFGALRKAGAPLIVSAITLGWICLTYLWSPYQLTDELWKLGLLTPLFALVPLTASQISAADRHQARVVMVFVIISVMLAMAMESLTLGDMTYSYKVDVEGYSGPRHLIHSAVDRVLSRGATPAMMMGGIVAIMLWITGNRILRGLAAGLGVICTIIAFDFNVSANGVAFIAAITVCALAARWPRQALPALLCAMAAIILFTPLIFWGALALTGDTVRSLLPLSWEWRLEIWSYALSRASEQPITGLGLGASRAINTETELRGMVIDLLPLHAHNAGMTIWLETGLIGAALISTSLLAIARAVARRTLSRPFVLMLCWAITIWFVNITVSYGVWQEWHHAALALSIAAAIVARPAGNLRHPA